MLERDTNRCTCNLNVKPYLFVCGLSAINQSKLQIGVELSKTGACQYQDKTGRKDARTPDVISKYCE